jgi:hypothetical protein
MVVLINNEFLPALLSFGQYMVMFLIFLQLLGSRLARFMVLLHKYSEGLFKI